MEATPMDDELLIWWTSEADCREIGDPGDDESDIPALPSGCPRYIREEYSSRYGRNGRGRLWVPDGIDLEEIPWDESRGPARTIERLSCAGIVFRRSDLASVRNLPGFVTDLRLNRVSS